MTIVNVTPVDPPNRSAGHNHHMWSEEDTKREIHIIIKISQGGCT